MPEGVPGSDARVQIEHMSSASYRLGLQFLDNHSRGPMAGYTEDIPGRTLNYCARSTKITCTKTQPANMRARKQLDRSADCQHSATKQQRYRSIYAANAKAVRRALWSF